MDIITATKQFKNSLKESRVNELGKATRLCQRQREVTPHRLLLALIHFFASGQLRPSISDIHRHFNALCNRGVQYKPFHNQLSKPAFPDFMRQVLSSMLNELACDVLRFSADSPFARFSHIHIQDGTSFALKPTLASTFPGRFSPQNPAAVELHVDLDLLSETPHQVCLTPDTAAEGPFLPPPDTLAGALLLADRGYFSRPYLQAVEAAGGHFVMRGKTNTDARVIRAFRPNGQEVVSWRGKRLRDLASRLRRRTVSDLDVCFDSRKPSFTCRLVVHSRPGFEKDALRFLFTNLSREDFSPQQISDAYRLRWQVELLFKEWKSHNGLCKVDTSNPHIAEGLIWAALCAAVVKRFWAHATQLIRQRPISTQTTAKAFHLVMDGIFLALLFHPNQLILAAQRVVSYLANNAVRAHPKRDMKTGRLKLGMGYVGVS